MSMTDINGNIYPTITINSLDFITEPYRATSFRDGTPMPLITDDAAWAADTSGAMCYYNNTPYSTMATPGYLTDDPEGTSTTLASSSEFDFNNIFNRTFATRYNVPITGKSVGDVGFGGSDLSEDPEFIDIDATIQTLDTSLGGLGTEGNFIEQSLTLNGFDINGDTIAPNTTYAINVALSFFRNSFTPTNRVLSEAGYLGVDIGAVDIQTSFSVIFDPQGATSESSPTSITVTDPETTVGTLPTPPTKTNSVFGGWYTEPLGAGTEFLADTEVVSGITVYAKWTRVVGINYYVSSEGSNTAPYDTPEKGANSTWTIRALSDLLPIDTIIMCSDIEETTFVEADAAKLCNIQALEGLPIRPELNYTVGANGPFYTGTEEVTIEGIKLINNNDANLLEAPNAVTINNCEIVLETTALISYVKNFTNNLVLCNSTPPNTMPLLSVLSGGSCDNNTIIDKSSGSNRIFIIATSVSSFKNNIIYSENTRGTASILSLVTVDDPTVVTNNMWYAPVYEGFFAEESVGFTEVVCPYTFQNNLLFINEVTYFLSIDSPAIKAGLNGVNIGWDLITFIVTRFVPRVDIGTVKSNPAGSNPGSINRDSDFGGGLEYGVNTSYNPSRDQSEIKSKVFNGYKAPNLR